MKIDFQGKEEREGGTVKDSSKLKSTELTRAHLEAAHEYNRNGLYRLV